MDDKSLHLSRKALKALSADTRVGIIKALNERQMTASELSRKLNKHVTTIEEHLDSLREAGLIERVETPGRKWVYHRLTNDGESVVKPKSYTSIILMLSVPLLAAIGGLFLLPALVGGPGSNDTQVIPGYGTLVLMVTDKFEMDNVTSIYITISSVDAHKTGASWFTVVNATQTINLVELIGVEEFLGESSLAAGNYTQIRLVITNASITINGTLHELRIPSEEIRLIHPFAIEENMTKTLVLDFVAADSVIEQGDGYALRPTIGIIER